MFPIYRFVSLCVCFIVVLKSGTADNSLCSLDPFFVPPPTNDCSQSNWDEYTVAANRTQTTLCEKIDNDEYGDDVRESAANILQNINYMNDAAKRIDARITEECLYSGENCLAADYVRADLKQRLLCFLEALALESSFAENALGVLLACVQQSGTTAASNIQSNAANCESIVNSVATQELESIQTYFGTPQLFPHDLPIVVASNTN